MALCLGSVLPNGKLKICLWEADWFWSSPFWTRFSYMCFQFKFYLLVFEILYIVWCASFVGRFEYNRKLYLVDWNIVITTIDRGSLSITRLEDLNAALIVKWIYRFTNERDSLWRRVVCAKSGVDATVTHYQHFYQEIFFGVLDRNNRGSG